MNQLEDIFKEFNTIFTYKDYDKFKYPKIHEDNLVTNNKKDCINLKK